jgi:hypothetical protein
MVNVHDAKAALTVNMDKKVIPIDTFYKGNSLTISGSVGGNEDVVVKNHSLRTACNLNCPYNRVFGNTGNCFC